MPGMLLFLMRHRRIAAPLSRGWWLLWAKRTVQFPILIRILLRRRRLIRRGASIGELSVIGDVVLNGKLANLKIGNDCAIGDGTHLALHDRITLGEKVIINDDCVFLTGSHDINDPSWRLVTGPITVGDLAWIAAKAMILPGVSIGRAAVVGAGAVVTKDVLPYQVVAGNPARVVAERTCREFSYSPVRFLPAIEAWLGPSNPSTKLD